MLVSDHASNGQKTIVSSIPVDDNSEYVRKLSTENWRVSDEKLNYRETSVPDFVEI